MIDINFICNNADDFDLAMKNRNCKISSKEIIPLYKIKRKETTSDQLDNRIKKTKASIFLLKRQGKCYLDKQEELNLIMIEQIETELEIFDLWIEYYGFKDEEWKTSMLETYGVIFD